jgi:uncharacterized repeat protein (TIGR03803 family)
MRLWLVVSKRAYLASVVVAASIGLVGASTWVSAPVVAQTVTTLHTFNGNDGSGPTHLLEGNDGLLYGTTLSGGAFGQGTLFRLKSDGNGFETLFSFGSSDGSFRIDARPTGLLQLSDGYLYGLASGSDVGSSAAIFRILPDGTDYSVIFQDFPPEEAQLIGVPRHLVLGSNGYLYGDLAGDSGLGGTIGKIFRIQPDGTDFQIVVDTRISVFPGTSGVVNTKLLQLSDGYFYTTANIDQRGRAIYRFLLDGTNLQFLSQDASPFGSYQLPTGLVQLSDRFLYGGAGFADFGGSNTTYRLLPDGTAPQIPLAPLEGLPNSELVQGSDGYLYGTTGDFSGSFGGATLFRSLPDGTNYKTVVSFNPETSFSISLNTLTPESSLFKGTDCSVYGVTSGNGTTDNGTIFKVTLDLSSCPVIRPIANDLGLAYGVAFNAQGNYVVPNFALGQLQEVKLDGSSQQLIASDLGLPTSVAVRSTGNYLVTDARGRLLEINSSDGSVTVLASNLGHLFGVAINPSDTAIVTDRFGGRLLSVTPSGDIAVIASDLGRPNSVVIDPVTGNYLVTDRNGRLLQITPTGTVTAIAETGLGRPAGLALDDGSAIVVDSFGKRVLRVSLGYQPGNIRVLSDNLWLGIPQAIAVVPGIQGQYAVTDAALGRLLNLR